MIDRFFVCLHIENLPEKIKIQNTLRNGKTDYIASKKRKVLRADNLRTSKKYFIFKLGNTHSKKQKSTQ